MVAENGNLFDGFFIELDLLVELHVLDSGLLSLVEFDLEGVRGIIGSEDLGSEPLHLGFQVLVQVRGVDLIEEVIVVLFVLFEILDILANLGVEFNGIFVSH